MLLHTNLGRAPLAHTQPAGYTNLELDLATGERGSRHDHVGRAAGPGRGAEAAIVVNNGAAAVLLVLAALARDRDVVVSRGELVEIGGGFRVPEVMAKSGCRLVEVGTTNRTRPADVIAAVEAPGADVAVVLKVHQTNYRIVGFTEAVSIAELAAVGPPVVVDLGSGLLDAACPWLPGGPPAWLADEPAVRQTLEAGADLVVFSGDKLLGGPQAGVIVGSAELVAALRPHPLARALRPGGLVLGALQEVALAYLRATPIGSRSGAWPPPPRPSCAPGRGRRGAIGRGRRGRRRGLRVGDRRRHAARRRDRLVRRPCPRRPPPRPPRRATPRSSPGSPRATPSATCAPSTRSTTRRLGAALAAVVAADR